MRESHIARPPSAAGHEDSHEKRGRLCRRRRLGGRFMLMSRHYDDDDDIAPAISRFMITPIFDYRLSMLMNAVYIDFYTLWFCFCMRATMARPVGLLFSAKMLSNEL